MEHRANPTHGLHGDLIQDHHAFRIVDDDIGKHMDREPGIRHQKSREQGMCGMAVLAEDTLDIELDGRAGGNEGTCIIAVPDQMALPTFRTDEGAEIDPGQEQMI